MNRDTCARVTRRKASVAGTSTARWTTSRGTSRGGQARARGLTSSTPPSLQAGRKATLLHCLRAVDFAATSPGNYTDGSLPSDDAFLLPGTDRDTMSDMHQIADIFFALANVLSFARIAHLLPANEQA